MLKNKVQKRKKRKPPIEFPADLAPFAIQRVRAVRLQRKPQFPRRGSEAFRFDAMNADRDRSAFEEDKEDQ